jgi:hypothetical protein
MEQAIRKKRQTLATRREQIKESY